ncbi:MAG: SDR family oxidoreductase [Anaerolineales bacterium]|nr:SDR family oxidoreductase [Anaerolineales bacterium]
MKILITGSSGLLGLNLALELAPDHTVVGADRNPLTSQLPFEAVGVDLLDPGVVAALLEDVQPDAVIHCAAMADVDACESEPQAARRMNAWLPGEIAAQCARYGIQLVHISTDAVFDGQSGGYTEEDPPNPLSEYARTKLDGEEAVFSAMPEAVVTRINIFGWSATANRSLAEFFYYNLAAGKPLKGFTDVIFCPLLVNHLAAVFALILEKKLSGLYHLVSPVGLSKYQFGVRIAELFGFDPTGIEPVKVADFGLKAARSLRLTLDTSKLSQALGRPLPDVFDGLERFYQLHQQGHQEKLKAMLG